MSIVIRRLDNPLVDHLVNQIRCLHGNQVLHKDDFARGLLASMRRGDGGHPDGYQHDPAPGNYSSTRLPCTRIRHDPLR